MLGVSLERRAVNRVLESDELERVVVVAINSAHIQAALKQALESDGAGPADRQSCSTAG